MQSFLEEYVKKYESKGKDNKEDEVKGKRLESSIDQNLIKKKNKCCKWFIYYCN